MGPSMIELYTSSTPNGYKASIMLEETGLPYTVKPVSLSRNEQMRPEFLALNPNNKIPVIVDHETGSVVFESGAILLYLAEKTGVLLPARYEAQIETQQWVLFQAAHVGPMFGQLWYFRRSAPETVKLAIERYDRECRRILGVLERRLNDREYLVGDYGIADIMTWPWVACHDHIGIALDDFPRVKRWHDTVAARSAVRKGITIPEPYPPRAAVPAKQPTEIVLEAGKKYWWCSCGRSATQPFCDGSHKSTGFEPRPIEPAETAKVWLCQCKASAKAPFCDGMHNRL